MREIKYRAWDGKKMRYPDGNSELLITFTGKCVQITEGMAVDGCPPIINYRREWVPIQFTGLLDKNGKEIYEGDIVSTYRKDGSVEQTNAVEWETDMWVWGVHGYLKQALSWHDSCEVIGNIYENPELLEE